MRLFSKIAFICNLSFILFIALAYVEFNHKKNKAGGGIVPLPFITGLLVILGQLAIFINLAFCVTVLVQWVSKKPVPSPRWLVAANLVLLLGQLCYFFI